MQYEPHRPTSRVLDILESLAQHKSGMTLTDLSHAVKASASTLTPFLRTLCARGYVDLNRTTMLYTLAAKTLLLSAAFSDNDIYTLVKQEMQAVVDCCGETCQLAIRDGGNVFYIAKVDSPQQLRLVSAEGRCLPATCTAIGKCLLCELDRAELEGLYPNGLAALTPSSLKDMDELASQLAGIRAGDFALDVDEAVEHLRCFALPIRLGGKIDAAISVSLPDFRLNEEKERAVRTCLETGRDAIERHLAAAGRGFASMSRAGA